MRHAWSRLLVIAALCVARSALGSTSEPVDDPTIDPAPCLSATGAPDDANRIVELCGRLIDSRKTARDDRIKALIARAAAFTRKGEIDRAIADDDDALRLDPNLADVLNARGELWLGKGERRKALADFAAALKLEPDHAAARNNHKRLALEVERLGVRKASQGKPSFDCARARQRVEKAICADPALADLDRGIHALYVRVLHENTGRPAALKALRREQDTFLADRRASFGRPQYDLRSAMKARLQRLTGVDGD
jgi:tetratricopeptide (TPR) repeat protein